MRNSTVGGYKLPSSSSDWTHWELRPTTGGESARLLPEHKDIKVVIFASSKQVYELFLTFQQTAHFHAAEIQTRT